MSWLWSQSVEFLIFLGNSLKWHGYHDYHIDFNHHDDHDYQDCYDHDDDDDECQFLVG